MSFFVGLLLLYCGYGGMPHCCALVHCLAYKVVIKAVSVLVLVRNNNLYLYIIIYYSDAHDDTGTGSRLYSTLLKLVHRVVTTTSGSGSVAVLSKQNSAYQL